MDVQHRYRPAGKGKYLGGFKGKQAGRDGRHKKYSQNKKIGQEMCIRDSIRRHGIQRLETDGCGAV